MRIMSVMSFSMIIWLHNIQMSLLWIAIGLCAKIYPTRDDGQWKHLLIRVREFPMNTLSTTVVIVPMFLKLHNLFYDRYIIKYIYISIKMHLYIYMYLYIWIYKCIWYIFIYFNVVNKIVCYVFNSILFILTKY